MNNSRGHIFKTTLLFGFVQIFNIGIKVVINKIIAILLGPEGIGIISLFQNSQQMLSNSAGLGISQSGVRDISEAYNAGDQVRFSKIIAILKRVIYITALLGIVVTVALAPLLSEWLFDSPNYTLSYIFLALSVALNILSEGQLAILKGMRRLRSLAKATMIGAIVGLFSSVPLIYAFDQQGIIPSLIAAALSAYVLSNYFVRQVEYTKVELTPREVYHGSKEMVKMGISLMTITFLGLLSALFIAAYVSSNGGLAILGYYQAGIVITTSYFGIVTTAMSTDYYPRISAVYNENEKLAEMANSQSMINLIIVMPMIVVFQLFADLFINILYTADFVTTLQFLNYAIIGAIITVCSNNFGMILLAKQKSKIFLISSILQRVLVTLASIVSYYYWGLVGLGIGYIFLGVLHFFVTWYILHKNFNISPSGKVMSILGLVILLSVISVIFREAPGVMMRYISSALLLSITLVISYYLVKIVLNINPFTALVKCLKTK